MSDPLAATVISPATAAAGAATVPSHDHDHAHGEDGHHTPRERPSAAVTTMLETTDDHHNGATSVDTKSAATETKDDAKLPTPTSATRTSAPAPAVVTITPSARALGGGAGSGSGNGGGIPPNPASALVEHFKNLGKRVADECRRDGKYVSTPLAAFAIRCQSMETGDLALPDKAKAAALAAAGGDGGAQAEAESELVTATARRILMTDNPLVETIKMQVVFETLYASELAQLRSKQVTDEQRNRQLLDKVVEVGTNIASNTQVASLYRAIFKLMLANSCVEESKIDRTVEREIAAALESVFPQAGLNAFNMMSADDKRRQINSLVSIVLGIRLFNREIKKGGAGLPDVPNLVTNEMDVVQKRLESESVDIGDLCYTYADIINLEHARPGTIAAPLARLQDELTNRRQYILFVHQLQHEVSESLELVMNTRQQLANEMEQLKALVGLKTSVPKEQVYPKFHMISGAWRVLMREREKNALRQALLEQLLAFKDSFATSLLEQDLELRDTPIEDKSDLVPEEFVPNSSDDAPTDGKDGHRVVRLVKETTANFMSLPLEHQGYCPVTLVQRRGLLLPGNPSLGIVRHATKHYSFASVKCMKDFVEDPDRFIEGVIGTARKLPALIHLLCLQPAIAASEISDYFSPGDSFDQRSMQLSASTSEKGVQTELHVEPEIDPNYHWNEWELRRKAIQMADLMSKRTHSTQTVLSHFKRDNETQDYTPLARADGSMPGKGTQTGVEKGTNVARVMKYHAGLRGHTTTKMSVASVTTPEFVVEGSNRPFAAVPAKTAKEITAAPRLAL